MGVEFNKKVSIITGGGSGIGKAISLELARNGSNVVIADVQYKGAREVSSECKRLGVESIPVKVDVSKYSDVKKLFDQTRKRFKRLDILINNAGILLTSPRIEDFDEKMFDKVIGINLKGTFLCCKEACKMMKKYRFGKIVNISSIAAKTGGQLSGPAYSASKAGIICLTKSFAQDLAPYAVNVNCIAPGIVDTPMVKDYPPNVVDLVPLKRKAKPEEIAYLVLFLVSDKASYITGEIVDINGGLLMD